MENTENVQLGTAEAAVRSCVNLIARATEQREDVLAYWLDLYYQVRLAFEIEQGTVEDPQLIRLEDLYPVIREILREQFRSTAKEKLEKKSEPKAKEQAPEKENLTPSEIKKQVIAELEEARANGVTIADILNASRGMLEENVLMNILERKRAPLSAYSALHVALSHLGADDE